MAAATASGEPMPRSMVSRPSAMTVVWASISLRSVCRIAQMAPSSMVMPPTMVSVQSQSGVPPMAGSSRAIR